ncbi:hypothetical protein F5Y11DRAFT_138148 [Daldinia sp. FL1419]|nr:hypothetical protein F5Y11DRAFT_138148 [Daldinia sp. FL1419]
MADTLRISTLVTHVENSLKNPIYSLDEDPNLATLAESHLNRVRLWTETSGARRWLKGNSLDYRLRSTSSLRDHIISLLEQLRKLIDRETGNYLVGDGPKCPTDKELGDYFLDNGDSNESIMNYIHRDISHILDCLLRLSIAIANPARHDKYDYDHQYIRIVVVKFPRIVYESTEKHAKMAKWRRKHLNNPDGETSKAPEDDGNANDELGNTTTVPSRVLGTPDTLAMKSRMLIPDHGCIGSTYLGISSLIFVSSLAQLSIANFLKEKNGLLTWNEPIGGVGIVLLASFVTL